MHTTFDCKYKTRISEMKCLLDWGMQLMQINHSRANYCATSECNKQVDCVSQSESRI